MILFSCRQWRYSEIGMRFLGMIIRHDHPFPVSGVKIFVNYLNHDLLTIRKVSLNFFFFFL